MNLYWFVPILPVSRSGPDDRALSSKPKAPGSMLAWRNNAMYTNGTWYMYNLSCVQCPPSSDPNYTSGGIKVGELPSPC